MNTKLSKQKREEIIINHIKGTPDPHFIVSESKNGRFTVKMKPIEIEDDEDEEGYVQDLENRVEAEEDDTDEGTDDEEPPPIPPHPIPKNGPSVLSSCGAKQNARRLLEQLAAMLPEDDEPPQRTQKNWGRRKLRF